MHFVQLLMMVHADVLISSSILICVIDDTLAQLATLLKSFGVDPRDLSPQQIKRLTLVLQLLQNTEKAGIE